mmetsp:Transcript_96866/g.269427  ORF Transcript_96866/g.269427 Transcript_96866/m.269427 type:complete len:279 (+) Transcript_96866:406-1242(+)
MRRKSRLSASLGGAAKASAEQSRRKPRSWTRRLSPGSTPSGTSNAWLRSRHSRPACDASCRTRASVNSWRPLGRDSNGGCTSAARKAAAARGRAHARPLPHVPRSSAPSACGSSASSSEQSAAATARSARCSQRASWRSAMSASSSACVRASGWKTMSGEGSSSKAPHTTSRSAAQSRGHGASPSPASAAVPGAGPSSANRPRATTKMAKGSPSVQSQRQRPSKRSRPTARTSTVIAQTATLRSTSRRAAKMAGSPRPSPMVGPARERKSPLKSWATR